jgi:multicomponent Na+:H+ antiporter subunit F
MISAGWVAAAAVAGLIVVMALAFWRCLRGPTLPDRIAAGIGLWLHGVLLAAVAGLWSGAGPAAIGAAATAFFAGLFGLVAVIKLARHRSIATALARPSGQDEGRI